MSTDVRVIGFDQNVPQWATEKTLDDVREILRKGYGLDKEQNAILESTFEEIQKTRTITSRYLESINKALKGGSVNTGFQTVHKQQQEAIKETTGNLSSLAGGAAMARLGLTGIGRHSGLLGSAMQLLSSKLTIGALVIAPLVSLIKGTISTVTQTIGAFEEYHKVGIVYNQGILAHREELARLGMSTKDMTEIVSKHARTISLVGIPKVMELGRALDTSGNELHKLGLTAKDAVKYSAQHLEMQRLMGVFEFQDAQSLSQATMNTMRSMTAYTKIMNKSREEIIESQKSMLDSADFARLIASLEPEMAAAVQSSFSNITGALAGSLPDAEAKRIGDLLTDMIAAPVATASKAYGDLVKAGQLDMANALLEGAEQVKQGGMSQADSFIFVRNLLNTAEQSAQSGWQQILSMNEATAEMATFFGGTLVKTGRESAARIAQWEQELGMAYTDPAFMNALAERISAEGEVATKVRGSWEKMTEGWDYAKVQAVFKLMGGEENLLAGLKHLDTGLKKVGETIWKLAGIEFDSMLANWAAAVAALGAVGVAAYGLRAVLMGIIGFGAKLAGVSAPAAAAGAGAGGALGVGKFLLKRIPLVMGVMGAVEGIQGFNADKDAGMLGRLGNAGSSALSGATMGLLGSSAVEIAQRTSTATPDTPSTRRIQQPEQISQSQIDEAINSAEGGDLAPLLQSIAMASNAQLEKVSELVRIVRSGQTGITGLQRAG